MNGQERQTRNAQISNNRYTKDTKAPYYIILQSSNDEENLGSRKQIEVAKKLIKIGMKYNYLDKMGSKRVKIFFENYEEAYEALSKKKKQ